MFGIANIFGVRNDLTNTVHLNTFFSSVNTIPYHLEPFLTTSSESYTTKFDALMKTTIIREIQAYPTLSVDWGER